MFRQIMVSAILLLSLISCTAHKNWSLTERAGGLGPTERIIPAWINPGVHADGQFGLYYFTTYPFDKSKPTILYCAGGPGIIVRFDPKKNYLDFLADRMPSSGYNVVYFHLRGSGISQIPPSNLYDRFLRTSYAVEDIELIREDLGINSWDAVVGSSYGTVLAQQYAKRYGGEGKVNKLVLIAPLSRHFAVDALDRTREKMIEIQLDTLKKLYDSDEALAYEDVEEIAKKTGNTLREAEEDFRGVQFVIDNYDQLKGELLKRRLNYGFRFFRALRELRNVGWNGWTPQKLALQEAISIAIAEELLRSKPQKLQRFLMKKKAGPKWDSTETELKNLDEPKSPSAMRVFYVVSIYDGVSIEFVEEWMKGDRRDIRDAIRKAAGRAHVEDSVNESIEKVGITHDELIAPWDPSKFSHAIPTLILKGGADPVTAGGQAEYIYTNGVVGPRTLMEFSGVGHEMDVPQVQVKNPSDDTLRICQKTQQPATDTLPLVLDPLLNCVISSFLQQDSLKFKDTMKSLQDNMIGYLDLKFSGSGSPFVKLPIQIVHCDPNENDEKDKCRLDVN